MIFIYLDVLVTSKRVEKRLRDLSDVETNDMFRLVQKVQNIMESLHKTSASTVTVQDGKEAGQTIEVSITAAKNYNNHNLMI